MVESGYPICLIRLILALTNWTNQEVNSIRFAIRSIGSTCLWFAQRIKRMGRIIQISESIFVRFVQIGRIFSHLFVIFERIDGRFTQFAVECDSICSIRSIRFVQFAQFDSPNSLWFARFASIRSTSFPDSHIVKNHDKCDGNRSRAV